MQIPDTLHRASHSLSLCEQRSRLRQSQEPPRSSDARASCSISSGSERESVTALPALDFELPPELEAGSPPETRGLARDQVHLMASYRSNNRVVHTHFRQIGDFLDAGDLLV